MTKFPTFTIGTPPQILSIETPPQILSFVVGGKAAVTIHNDGRVEVHDGFTADEAARAFWDAVVGMAPEYFGKK